MISRSLSTGLAKELRDSGVDLKNGAVDLAKVARDNPSLVLGALWNATKGLPSAVVDSVVESGHALGEGAAVAANDELSKKLNAIYGNDVSGYQRGLLAIRTLSVVTATAGAATATAEVQDRVATAINKKLDEVAAAKAQAAAGELGSVRTSAPRLIPGFSEVESGKIDETRVILGSQELARVRAAHESGQTVIIVVNGRVIQYEPGLPASGMTMFGENGFLIGAEAFSSETELRKTLLHELYRLTTTASSGGVSGSLASQETAAAFSFANRAFKQLNEGVK